MPLYDFRCNSCETIFEKQLSISNRNDPLTEICFVCGEKGTINRHYAGKYSNVVEIENLHGYKKLPSDWKYFLSEMKKQNPNSNVHD